MQNTEKKSLAHISLRWMVRECFRTSTGILFDPEQLKEIRLDPESLACVDVDGADKLVPGTPERENVGLQDRVEPQVDAEDQTDVRRKLNDELVATWWWWIIELLYT